MSDLGILSYMMTLASEGGHFDWAYVAKHAINLLMLIALVVYFVKEPAKKFLRERRINLRKEIDEAQQTIEEALAQYKQYEERLANIEAEIASLRDSIVREAEVEKREILERAKEIAQVIKEEALEDIKVEVVKARKELQKNIVVDVMSEAEKIIRKNVSKEELDNSINQFVEKVREERWLQ